MSACRKHSKSPAAQQEHQNLMKSAGIKGKRCTEQACMIAVHMLSPFTVWLHNTDSGLYNEANEHG